MSNVRYTIKMIQNFECVDFIMKTDFLPINLYYRFIGRIHKLRDWGFDRTNNIETCEPINISDLKDDLNFSGYEIDELYSGTPTCLFNALHKPVAMKNLQNATFIDIGSGKSRIIVQAAKAGFRQLQGIEFSQTLAQIGRENCHAAIKCKTVNWKIFEQDARHMHFPDGDMVIFMYNPFDGPIMDEFIKNLAANVKANPRSVILIYNHSHYAQNINDHVSFKPIKYPFLTWLKLKLLNPHHFGAWEVVI